MKLPKEIKKKVEEWKFMSGALVMCLVAYSRSSGISVHQYISPNSTDLTQFTVSRVLPFKGIRLPIPVMSGGKDLMKLLKIGL